MCCVSFEQFLSNLEQHETVDISLYQFQRLVTTCLDQKNMEFDYNSIDEAIEQIVSVCQIPIQRNLMISLPDAVSIGTIVCEAPRPPQDN